MAEMEEKQHVSKSQKAEFISERDDGKSVDKQSEDYKTVQRSWIWKYFNKVSPRLYKCNLCKGDGSLIKDYNNMYGHIKLKHHGVYNTEVEEIQNVCKNQETEVVYIIERKKNNDDIPSVLDNQLKNNFNIRHNNNEVLKDSVEGADDVQDSSWVWLLFDSAENDIYSCRICQFKCSKVEDTKENIANIYDHLSVKHGLVNSDQVTVQDDDDNDD